MLTEEYNPAMEMDEIDDEPNTCFGCGVECYGEYCNECQEDGTEYLDRMNAAAEQMKPPKHKNNKQSVTQ